jgi:hypothetical protein
MPCAGKISGKKYAYMFSFKEFKEAVEMVALDQKAFPYDDQIQRYHICCLRETDNGDWFPTVVPNDNLSTIDEIDKYRANYDDLIVYDSAFNSSRQVDELVFSEVVGVESMEELLLRIRNKKDSRKLTVTG